MTIDSFVFSDPGGRKRNEDSARVFSCGDLSCFVLCDGLGGHLGGDLASQCVCNAIQTFFTANDGPAKAESLAALLGRAVCGAQEALVDLQSANGISGGLLTTLCCLLLRSGDAAAVYVGDSRIYRFSGGRAVARTKDHSVPQHLVNIGELPESGVRGHEDRSRLLRVMGTDWEDPMFQPFPIDLPLVSGDAFLLCSDGFWEPVLESDMERLLADTHSAEDWARRMAALVPERVAPREQDNYTAITVRIP